MTAVLIYNDRFRIRTITYIFHSVNKTLSGIQVKKVQIRMGSAQKGTPPSTIRCMFIYTRVRNVLSG